MIEKILAVTSLVLSLLCLLGCLAIAFWTIELDERRLQQITAIQDTYYSELESLRNEHQITQAYLAAQRVELVRQGCAIPVKENP